MFGDQLNSFPRGHHANKDSYNNMLSTFASHISAPPMGPITPPGFSASNYVKKRSYSDHTSETHQERDLPNTKRSRTAPPSPPNSQSRHRNDAARFAADKPFSRSERSNITLPSLSDALEASSTRARPPQAIVPTVSLDYFDTYKPNDENWRYGLLDTIKHTTPSFNLSQYSYLNKHSATRLPSLRQLDAEKPFFDSRVSPKALPEPAERKINFPFESNYTYLNKTYMVDVERYPEYLELAQSLIKLSKPQTQTKTPEQVYTPLHKPFSHTQVPQTHHNDHQERSQNEKFSHSHSDNHRSTYIHIYSNQNTHTNHPSHSSHPNQTTHTSKSTNTTHPPYYRESSFPIASPLVSLMPVMSLAYLTPENSFEAAREHKEKKVSLQRTRFIPITPPSVKNKSRSELMKSPPRMNPATPRVCISCGSDLSPCWRPSWSIKEGQLCNSCGLRYKKTGARCLNNDCKKIPAKGEWALMQSKGKTSFDGEDAYGCLDCGSKVEVNR